MSPAPPSSQMPPGPRPRIRCSPLILLFFLMIRRHQSSTPKPSSAASALSTRQAFLFTISSAIACFGWASYPGAIPRRMKGGSGWLGLPGVYTHLRDHETLLYLVCRLLLEKKNVFRIVYSIILGVLMTNLLAVTLQPFFARVSQPLDL